MNDKCTNMAVIKRHWPGSDPDLVCIEHADDSKRVADAMGFRLLLEPISYKPEDTIHNEAPTCCCTAGFSQKASAG